MAKTDTKTDHNLRQRAEDTIREKPLSAQEPLSPEQTQRLLHELQVHQIELEMQNAELCQARDELEKSLEKYTDLYEFAPVGYFTLDRNGDIISVNLRGASLVGVARARLLGHSFGRLVTDKYRHVFTDFLDTVFINQDKIVCEVALQKKENLPLFVHLEAMTTISGKECGLVLIDITERINAENELRKNRELLQAVINGAEDSIFLKDRDSRYVLLNPATERVLGKVAEEVVGRELTEIHTGPEIAAAILKNDRRILESGQAEVFEETVRFGSGYRTFLSSKSPRRDADGRVIGLISVSHDITERKRAEEIISASEKRFRTLVDTIPDLIWLKDKDGVYLSCNKMFERLVGAKEAEILGKTDYDFVDKELADFFREHDSKTMAKGKPNSNEEWVTFTNDGHHALLETIKTPMYDGKGNLIGVLGIGHEITKRKQAEDDLRSYARRLIEMEEELRKKLATELHDEIGSDLTVLGMNLAIISNSLTDETEKKLFESIVDSGRLIKRISSTVRGIMACLRPPMLDDFGLPSTLRWHAELFSERTGINVSVQADKPFPRLKPEKETALFRISQEALLNVAKHANTKTVTINLEIVDGMICFSVVDEGKGIMPASSSHIQNGSGWGMKIMRERAELIGGNFQVESAPGKGTVVSVKLPLEDV